MYVQPGPPCLRLTRRVRASQVAGLLAAFALTGFVLFDALDLDGLAEAFSKAKTALVSTTLAETEAERSAAQPRPAEIVEVASQPAASSVIAQSYSDATRNSGRRLSHRMIPHATPPPPADPL